MWTVKTFTRLQGCSLSPYVDSEDFYEATRMQCSPYVDSEDFYEATRMQCSPYVDSEDFYEATRMQFISICGQ